MPTPISASGPAASTVIPTVDGPPPSPPVVTIEPVYIEGDAGARQLVSPHEAHKTRGDCLPQTRDATTSSLALIAGTLGTAAAITATGGTALFIAGCLVSLFGLSIDAGAKIHDLQECTKS